jgi:STE24 endopeptidase
MKSKKYNRIKLTIGIAKGILTFLILFYFVASDLSFRLDFWLSDNIYNIYLKFLAYVFIVGAWLAVIFLPVNFYSGFYLEHKFNLSNQTFGKWIFENLKGLLVSLIIGTPILLFFYYSVLEFEQMWWLPFAIVLFIVSVILARIVPVFILPLFYKITPIDNEELKSRIKRLGDEAGIKVENVYKFDMSKNTKKANAAFTGIGKSKRILLGDTLLDNYTDDEIETVIAHELGHYKKKHIIKNILIGTASSFLTLFLIATLYKISLDWFNYNGIAQISALPLLSLWGMVIGVIQTPLSNILSRKYEYEADGYAITTTGKPLAFINTLEKLNEQNLGDKDPHPFVEWFFYSHPSIKNRVSSIKIISNQKGLTSVSDLKISLTRRQAKCLRLSSFFL